MSKKGELKERPVVSTVKETDKSLGRLKYIWFTRQSIGKRE